MQKMINFITESPWINLFAGVILLVSSGNEIISSLDHFSLKSHHGVALFGLIQVIQTFPHLLHGLKEVQESKLLK